MQFRRSSLSRIRYCDYAKTIMAGCPRFQRSLIIMDSYCMVCSKLPLLAFMMKQSRLCFLSCTCLYHYLRSDMVARGWFENIEACCLLGPAYLVSYFLMLCRPADVPSRVMLLAVVIHSETSLSETQSSSNA